MAPKAFVSYCWSSPEHEKWVVALASQLRESGVDVILDKWDLKEGHDSVAFMERMVTDPEIKKVIVVLDQAYAEKADGRKGGVGTETQIISAEVYKKAGQDKFVGVIAERDSEGAPFLPAYYKSRIYIDLSEVDAYASNFDQLLRWVFDKPLYAKPVLGKPPEFLKDNAIILGTQSRARRAIELLRSGGRGVDGAHDDYFSAFVEGMEQFRLSGPKKESSLDDDLVANIEAFLPYRNEYIEVVGTLARYWPFDGTTQLQKFLEKAAVYLFTPPAAVVWSDVASENFRFIVHELFLYTVALLIDAERFGATADLLKAGYYLGEFAEDRNQPVEDYIIFRHHLRSLAHRNQRLNLNRLSLHAEFLEQRSHSSGIRFRSIMQADFILYLRSSVLAVRSQMKQWWPETLVFAALRFNQPFEVFARAQSLSYFEKIKPMFDVDAVIELQTALSRLQSDGQPYIPRWQFDAIDPLLLANAAKLATKQ